MLTLQFNAEVEFDIRDSQNWYNMKLAGLGDQFQDYVYHCFDEILKLPLISPIKYNKIRVRRIHKKFPHYVHYEVFEKENVIIVFGVFHAKRNPKLWNERIG
jgi:hypothetical protein